MKNLYLSNTKSKLAEKKQESEKSTIERITSATKAIEAYRKLKEAKKELTETELSQLDKECEVIEKREIIELDSKHEPVEIELTGKGKIQIGPPTLTKFEEARIIGARALQLSLGAPPFIKIPKNVKTSLEIAMIELEKRVIPIVIRRVFPNKDYQNIPIDYFN